MTREEAIKELSGFIGQLTEGCQEAIKVLIPELAESEDERMIKAIVDALLSHSNSINLLSLRGFQIEDVKAWLEKQKEQKDYRKLYEDIAKSEWFKKAYEGKSLGCDEEQKEQKPINESNMHEPTLDEARKWNEEYEKGYSLGYENGRNEQRLEWSNEDENRFNNLCRIIREAEGWNEVSKNVFIDWLKSLRPQPRWKPSEEQMEALFWTLHQPEEVNKFMKQSLRELYNDLQNMM